MSSFCNSLLDVFCINDIFSTLSFFHSNSFILLFLAFFFYFFINTIMSIAPHSFGINGVYLLSIVSVTTFWLIQLLFFKNIFFFNESYKLNFEFAGPILGNIEFNFSLKINFLSFSFLFLTTSIGVGAIIYSLTYFKNEPHADRFIIFLNWFILSMSLLLTADNAILLFLGWELIGLTSFLLINFWTLRRNTLKSAFKAFSFNKISDVFLIIFLVIIAQLTHTASISSWEDYFLYFYYFSSVDLLVPAIFLIIASSIKSAQLFFHLWLPDSMEAPIPASALIHSATLVSAGIYLLLKFFILIKLNNLENLIIAIGGITAFYGAVVSAAQTDCKKLLAYSTISHCGYLFICVGLDNIFLCTLYLYLHGFFKALTFFCVGNFVKVSKSYQDVRKMGQLCLLLPIESFLLIVCSSNLAALPFSVGYFYKYVLQFFFINNNFSFFLLPFIFFGMLCSLVYFFRLVYYILFDINKNSEYLFFSFFSFNLKKKKKFYTQTSILSTLSIFFLILVSFLIKFYFLEKFLIYKNIFIYNSGYLFLYDFLKIFNVSFTFYLYLFYIFFFSIGFFLLKIYCREIFSYYERIYFTLYLFFFFYFFFFFVI